MTVDNDTRAMTYGEYMQGCVKGEKDIIFVKPRVVLQQCHKTLADHTCGAKNADLQLFGHNNLWV